MAPRRQAQPLFPGEASRHPTLHAAALRYITEVGRRGSIRKAAETLNVAPSAVNRQILKLEQNLGATLFDRRPDGMRPTQAGEILLRHIRDTLADYDRLLSEIDGLRGIRSGHVRIAALDSLLVDFLPTMLEDFSVRHPAIAFSVLAAAPMPIFHQLITAQADIGLTFATATSPAVQLVASVTMPLGAVMSARHPLAHRARIDFADLAGYPVLMQHDDLPVMPLIDDDFSAFRAAARPRITSNSIELLRRAIRADLGIAFFTRLGFLREIASGELVWRPLASPRLRHLQLGLYTPAQRALGPAAALVVTDLVSRLKLLESTP